MPDEIILDKQTFEALAIDTRVNILKALKKRRKTQSELSKELKLAASTISEHLSKMQDASLIQRKKQGKKWVYYELTDKGEQILSPRKTTAFVFAVSVSILAIVAGMYVYGFGYSVTAGSPMASRAESSIVDSEFVTAGGAVISENDTDDINDIVTTPPFGYVQNYSVNKADVSPVFSSAELGVFLIAVGILAFVYSVIWYRKKNYYQRGI